MPTAVRREAAEALVWIGPKAVQDLVDALTRTSEEGRARTVALAMPVLAAIGAPAVPALAAASSLADADARSRVLKALGAVGSPETVPAVVIALGDADKTVRDAATRAVLDIDSEAVPGLIEALRSEVARRRAAVLLGRAGPTAWR